jgi:hypothetical protein
MNRKMHTHKSVKRAGHGSKSGKLDRFLKAVWRKAKSWKYFGRRIEKVEVNVLSQIIAYLILKSIFPQLPVLLQWLWELLHILR